MPEPGTTYVTMERSPFADAPALLEDARTQMGSAEQQLDEILGHLAAARMGLIQLFGGSMDGNGLNIIHATLRAAGALEPPEAAIGDSITGQSLGSLVAAADAENVKARESLARAHRLGHPLIGILRRLRNHILDAGGHVMDAIDHTDNAVFDLYTLGESAELLGPDVSASPMIVTQNQADSA